LTSSIEIIYCWEIHWKLKFIFFFHIYPFSFYFFHLRAIIFCYPRLDSCSQFYYKVIHSFEVIRSFFLVFILQIFLFRIFFLLFIKLMVYYYLVSIRILKAHKQEQIFYLDADSLLVIFFLFNYQNYYVIC